MMRTQIILNNLTVIKSNTQNLIYEYRLLESEKWNHYDSLFLDLLEGVVTKIKQAEKLLDDSEAYDSMRLDIKNYINYLFAKERSTPGFNIGE